MRHLGHGLFILGLLSLPCAARAQTLAAVRAAQHLDCGTVEGVEDWNGEDIHGNLSDLGGEICRTVAVATQFGVSFGPPVFYDSQRIMVSKESGITDLSGLRDRLICALDMTPPERTLRDELTARNIPYALQAHSEQGELNASVAVRRCAADTGMETRLAQSRANFHARTSDFVFLPERFALSPVVPAYLNTDQVFGLIVAWTVSALIEAEGLGITQGNVAEAAKREDMQAEQLLGHDFATAQALGLAHDWAAKAIAATGNYGEIFERTTGHPYHLDRGMNALWTSGGIMAPWPM